MCALLQCVAKYHLQVRHRLLLADLRAKQILFHHPQGTQTHSLVGFGGKYLNPSLGTLLHFSAILLSFHFPIFSQEKSANPNIQSAGQRLLIAAQH